MSYTLLLPLSLFFNISLAPLVRGAMNGMDMSMDGAMQMPVGSMLAYLHFTPGDNLWFLGWVPASPGTLAGACVGLFLLAVIERWIAACRAMMEVHWRLRAQIALSDALNTVSTKTKGRRATPTLVQVLTLRGAPPFVPSHDAVRGVMHVGQAALGFAFMLAVMTFQVSFVLAIVVGAGVGETLFGRYIEPGAHLL